MQRFIRSTGARLTAAAAAGFVCAIAGAAHADEWKPNEKTAATLQTEQTFDGFSVRLPASVASPTIGDIDGGKGKSYTWSLSPSDDKGGVFIITTEPATPGRTPDQLLTDWMSKSVVARLDGIGKSAVQTGTVGTGSFTRIYYHGHEKSGSKALVHGLIYAGVAQDHIFVIEAQDATSKYTSSLPQTEASALTLKAIAAVAAKPAETNKELSSEAHQADLADAAQVEGYSVRPPKGYMRANFPLPGAGTPITAWQGEQNERGMRPMFIFQTMPVKGSSTAPIEDGMDTAVEMLRRFMPGVQVDATQYGTIHGLDCAYTTYSSASPQTMQDLHGVIYSIHDGDKVLIAGGIDAAPNSDKSVPIIEAACRSIRKP